MGARSPPFPTTDLVAAVTSITSSSGDTIEVVTA
eukprot:SAG31_NODE_27634_length_422_cov_5.164087_1_plen_33_part_10